MAIKIKSKAWKPYTFMLVFILILVAIVAFMDYQQYPAAFWYYSLLLAVVTALIYYYFRRDKSQAISLFLIFSTLILFGLEDLLFYLGGALFGQAIPATMPHLDSHKVIGTVSHMLTFTNVTLQSLFISVFIGLCVSYIIYYFLRRK